MGGVLPTISTGPYVPSNGGGVGDGVGGGVVGTVGVGVAVGTGSGDLVGVGDAAGADGLTDGDGPGASVADGVGVSVAPPPSSPPQPNIKATNTRHNAIARFLTSLILVGPTRYDFRPQVTFCEAVCRCRGRFRRQLPPLAD